MGNWISLMGYWISPMTMAIWLCFVTALWVEAIVGDIGAFSNYSDALKSVMDLTPLQLDILSVAKDLGKTCGILAALVSHLVYPSLLLLIGLIECIIGYGVQWLIVSHIIQPLPYWQMCIFVWMAGNFMTWINTAILVTCIRNFPNRRGIVNGILKGYRRLSSPIFTIISTAFFHKDPSRDILVLTVVPFIVCLLAAVFLREVRPSAEEKYEERYFFVLYVVAVAIAVCLHIFNSTGEHGTTQSQIFCIILLMLLASLVSVPVHIAIQNSTGSNNKTLDVEACTTVVKEVPALATKSTPVLGDDYTVMEALTTTDFWILFMSFFVGVGLGLVVQNNMDQMALAAGYADDSKFISLIGISGFFGRIGSGIISEYFIKKIRTPRPIWNATSQILMEMVYVLMAIDMPGSLYIGSIVVEICYGVCLTITITSASEMFGLKYFGVIYNIIIINVPLGSFLFSDLLVGFLYGSDVSGYTCVGSHCYRLVFTVMAIVCMVGFILNVWLTIRTKALYSKIYTQGKEVRGNMI